MNLNLEKARSLVKPFVHSAERLQRSQEYLDQFSGVVYHFLDWVDKNNLRLDGLTKVLLDSHLKEVAGEGSTGVGRDVIRYKIKAYLRWLIKNGQLKITLKEIFPTRAKGVLKIPLNLDAATYLAERKPRIAGKTIVHYRYSLNHFYRWLSQNGIEVENVTNARFRSFLEYLKNCGIRDAHKRIISQKIQRFLYWQIERGKLKQDPHTLFANIAVRPRYLSEFATKHLPEQTQTFLALQKTILRQGSFNNYKLTLKKFHRFSLSKNIDVRGVARKHIEEWLGELHAAKLSASSRHQHIVCLRVYLQWLYEHHFIDVVPETLIKLSDIPKRPRYLPRPLPVDIDREVIRRLEKSSDPHHKGVLLMRLTGIRISELHNLAFNCVREDHAGNHYLKVPLGKLNNERMVPLDDRAVNVIKEIQKDSIEYSGGQNPTTLLINKYGRPPCKATTQTYLRNLCSDIETDQPITSHRMRHTYATSLLNGGMSLVGVMHLLGHHSIKMTLRYAAVTQDTVTGEYLSAVKKIESRYAFVDSKMKGNVQPDDPLEAINSVVQWIRKNVSGVNKTKNTLLLKRLHRFKFEIGELLHQNPSP